MRSLAASSSIVAARRRSTSSQSVGVRCQRVVRSLEIPAPHPEVCIDEQKVGQRHSGRSVSSPRRVATRAATFTSPRECAALAASASGVPARPRTTDISPPPRMLARRILGRPARDRACQPQRDRRRPSRRRPPLRRSGARRDGPVLVRSSEPRMDIPAPGRALSVVDDRAHDRCLNVTTPRETATSPSPSAGPSA